MKIRTDDGAGALVAPERTPERKKYGIIYADPPWGYDDEANDGERGAKFKYPVMATRDIAAMRVGQIAEPDCALFMWATWPMLGEALDVMKAWGFKYSTAAFVWVKTGGTATPMTTIRRGLRRLGVETKIARAAGKFLEPMLLPSIFVGMGKSTRANTEVCLLGYRGRLGRVDAGVRQVLLAPRREHSQKPPEVRDLIVRLLGPERTRVELFARDRVAGWDAWGNQAPGGEDCIIPMQMTMFGDDAAVAPADAPEVALEGAIGG